MTQTTKYSLSGWLSSKFLLLLLASVSAIGQSADSGSRETLTSKYSLAMLEAHQANSLEKIVDFYHYLNLLSATDDTELQNQIKENIYTLFEHRNTLVSDFTTDQTGQIPLAHLLDNIASGKLRFSVENESFAREFYRNYWYDTYELEITSGDVKTRRQISQVIYFKPEDKTFGKTKKTVPAVLLGPIR